MKKVTKAVFPVAGMGSRFLPATKAQPKEMLPIVDKPLIQYAVEEAVAAGIKELIFITGRNKRAIEDHFDKAYELENELTLAGKKEMLAFVQNILPADVSCIYIRQSAPLGLGHAVLCAEPVVGDEPFAIILADDLMDVEDGTPNVLAQMLAVHEEEQASVVAVQEVPKAQTNQYGIVSVNQEKERLGRLSGIVEKPLPHLAPSNLAVVGRYVLNAKVFDHIRKMGRGVGGEIQLTDGIASLLSEESVMAYNYIGERYDCGAKGGYLKATVSLGLKHPQVKEELKSYLQQLDLTD